MATIPDPAGLKTYQPRVQAGVSASLYEGSIAPGLNDLSKALAVTGEAQSRATYSRASADFMVNLVGSESELQHDPNYSSHEDRFIKSASEKQAEYAANIGDMSYRQQFVDETNLVIEKARARVKESAFGKEREEAVGYLDSVMPKLRDAAIVTGEIADANRNMENILNSYIERDYIGKDDAPKVLKDFRDSLSKGFIESKAPEDRLSHIESIKGYVDADVYAKLVREATNEKRAVDARNVVQSWQDAGLSYADAVSRTATIKDQKLFEAVNERRDAAYADQELARQRNQRDIMSTWTDSIRFESTPVSDLRKGSPDKWEQLTSDQKLNLLAMEANRGKTIRHDHNAELMLTDAMNRSPAAASKLLDDVSGSLSDEQYQRWSKAIAGDFKTKYASLSEVLKIASQRGKRMELNKDQQAMLDETITGIFTNNDEKITMREGIDAINEYTKSIDMPGYFSSDKYAFELNDQDRVDLVQEQDQDGYESVMEFMDAKKVPMTTTNFMLYYGKLKEVRSQQQSGQQAPVTTPEQNMAPTDTQTAPQNPKLEPLQPQSQKPATALPPLPGVSERDKTLTDAWYAMTEQEQAAAAEKLKADNPDKLKKLERSSGKNPSPWQVYSYIKGTEPVPFKMTPEYFNKLTGDQKQALVTMVKQRYPQEYDKVVEDYLQMDMRPSEWQIVSSVSDEVNG